VIPVGSTFTPNDPLAVWILAVVIVALAVTFLIAKHNLKDRF
jgi:hypothetical protein